MFAKSEKIQLNRNIDFFLEFRQEVPPNIQNLYHWRHL